MARNDGLFGDVIDDRDNSAYSADIDEPDLDELDELDGLSSDLDNWSVDGEGDDFGYADNRDYLSGFFR